MMVMQSIYDTAEKSNFPGERSKMYITESPTY